MMYWNHFYCSVDNKRIQLYIEDTAGCERFGFIPPVYYSRANGIVFVFDVCDRESLLQIDRFLEQVNTNSRGFVVKMLVGNKIDSPNRQVSEE